MIDGTDRQAVNPIARRRRVLMELDPHCWYCGCEVYEYPQALLGHKTGRDPLPDDQATLEHRFSRSRWNPRKRVILPCPFEWDDRVLLACKWCNEERGHWGEALMRWLDKETA